MSDRLAVFNEGRIEQIGTPAEVYEHPHTEFVAGFVGVSNVLERDGRRFTIRPEKIHMAEDGDGEPGVVQEVVYVGMVTRYIVELDSGGELVVVRQNLETSSQQALEERASASGSPGGRSTRSRSERRASEGHHEVASARGRVRRGPVRPRVGRLRRQRAAHVDRPRRGAAQPDRVGGLHPAAVGEAVRRRPAAR